MSDSQIQTDIREIEKEIKDLIRGQERGDTAHKNLKEMLEKHIKNSEKWRENTDAQMQAIAQSLLQDQTRDEVVSKQEEKWDNKRLVLWTTGILAIATLLTNFSEVIGMVKNVLVVFG